MARLDEANPDLAAVFYVDGHVRAYQGTRKVAKTHLSRLFLRAADKFPDTLSTQQPTDADAIEVAIAGLGDAPRPQGWTPLTGCSGSWRIGVGNYRVCYQVDNGKLLVLVITISTRDDVHDALRRYLGR